MFRRSYIEKFEDGTQVLFGPGKFDDWCVYQTQIDGTQVAPRDEDYFGFFQDLARQTSRQKVYHDFMSIYEGTSTKVSRTTLALIKRLSGDYPLDIRLEAHKNFVVIYAGMIAEENKDRAVLKKKIKRIGFYQAIVLNWPVDKAANFSKGRKATELLDYFNALESGNRPA